MLASHSHAAIAAGLISAIIFWGANNVGVKYLVRDWPPFWIGCSRMIAVGGVLLALLRWTRWLGDRVALPPALRRDLWWRGGLSLAVYVTLFTVSLQFTSASHVALYLGTAPVWALLCEGRPRWDLDSLRRYGAAGLALAGLTVLFWPKLQAGGGDWRGDLLAVAASMTWTVYGRQCRVLGVTLSGAEITAHTMWRAAWWLAPFAVWELATRPVPWRWELAGVQAYCAVFGGLISFALYNNALRHWPTSQVFLFSNLIPASTMAWAWLLIGEPVTATFGLAMLLVVAGVALGQASWLRALGNRWLPSE